MSPGRRRGATVPETLVAAALLGLALAGGLGLVAAIAGRTRSSAGAHAVAAELRRLRSEAIARARNMGLGLELDGEGTWRVSIVEDGDGDGLRSDDLRRGVDRVREGPVAAVSRWGVQPGFMRGLAELRSPPPSETPLADLSDPVRFGTRDLVSCGPRGTITPGTMYLTDGRERQMAVVVAGGSGRVRVWEWRQGSRDWMLR